jgi:hypothetical protein
MEITGYSALYALAVMKQSMWCEDFNPILIRIFDKYNTLSDVVIKLTK